jgi:Rap1a immunity proteins
MMMRTRAAAVLLIAAASPAAAYDTGNEFYTQCSNLSYQPYCLGFVIGVASGFNTGLQLDPSNPVEAQVRKDELGICAPDNAMAGQFLDLVMQFLRDHPERRHWSATILIIGTLRTYWPCIEAMNKLLGCAALAQPSWRRGTFWPGTFWPPVSRIARRHKGMTVAVAERVG